MTDAFQALIDKHQARMKLMRDALDLDGSLLAVSRQDPSYSILLTRNGSSDAAWRVTSFRDRVPVGHREYGMLDGGGPTQNALQEFAGEDMVLVPRDHRRRPVAGSVSA
jgi:hypothetical protein